MRLQKKLKLDLGQNAGNRWNRLTSQPEVINEVSPIYLPSSNLYNFLVVKELKEVCKNFRINYAFC